MSDLNGTVVGIQGRDVDSAAPNDGDVYRWDAGASKWVPVAPPQPLEPWTGTVHSQKQVIKRIPWVASTVGGTLVSTGVSYTLPTDSGLIMIVYGAIRYRNSPQGVAGSVQYIVATNVGGTVLTPTVNVTGGFAANNGSVVDGLVLSLAVSGTTVTLKASGGSFDMSGLDLDMQGYVDLMVI